MDLPPPPPAVVRDVAATFGFPWELLYALCWQEGGGAWRPDLICENENAPPDVGAAQVNLGTARQLGKAWATIGVNELLDEGTNLTAAALILRWRTFEVLELRGERVPWVEGRPDYAAMMRLLDEMPPATQRAVYEHAVAGYAAGNAGVEYWPDLDASPALTPEKARAKTVHVQRVMALYDQLREAEY